MVESIIINNGQRRHRIIENILRELLRFEWATVLTFGRLKGKSL